MNNKNMKVKIYKRIVEEVESQLDYPLYLYYQDEDCLTDTLIKVDEENTTTVKLGRKLSIEIERTTPLEEWEINPRNITDKEHYEEVLFEAIKHL